MSERPAPTGPAAFAAAFVVVPIVVLVLADGPAAAFELRGRLVDGADGAPIADTAFRLTLIDEARSGRSWRGSTDAEGRLAVDLDGLRSLPPGAALAASVEDAARGRPSHHSLAVTPRPGEEPEFRLYNTSDDSSTLRGGLGAFFSLADDPGGGPQRLKVRLMLRVTNAGRDLYVGRRLDRDALASTRACFRIPLPGRPGVGLEVLANEASAGAMPFTITPDGWAILDSPIPPLAEAPRGSEWNLHYVVPASQETVLPFPIDLPLDQMYAFGVEKEIGLDTAAPAGAPGLQPGGVAPLGDPETGDPTNWVVLHGGGLMPGTTIPVAVTVDSARLGQVNFRTLRTVTGFVVGSLIALLAGLVLGRRGPRVEAVLAGASGEEIIERIAQLDAQFQTGLVPKPEYREKRERLLSLARYEVPELAGGGAKGAAALPPSVLRLADRIGELGEGAATDPKKIQERLLLLEELAREITRHATGSAKAGGGAGGEQRGSGGKAGGGPAGERGGARGEGGAPAAERHVAGGAGEKPAGERRDAGEAEG